MQAARDDPEKGLESLNKAQVIQRRLIDRFPGESSYRKRLADMINVQGYVYFKRADYPNALRSFREVQGICQSLLEGITSGVPPVQLLNSLALSHYNIAAVELNDGHNEAALEAFAKTLESREALVNAHPSVTDFQEKLGLVLTEIAPLQHATRRDSEAFTSIRRSIEVLDRLVKSQPDQPRFHGDLGRSWNTLGLLLDEARDNAQAIPAFTRAIADQELALRGFPDDFSYKEQLYIELENLGEQYIDLGKIADGLPYYRRAIELRAELADTHAGDRGLAIKVADSLWKLATIHRHAGEPAEARKAFARGGAFLKPFAEGTPGDSPVQGLFGAVLTGEALAIADQGRVSEALPILRRAVATLKLVGSPETGDIRAKGWLSEALWELARLLRAGGLATEADLLDAERQLLWKPGSARELARLALQQTSRAALIGYGKTPLGEAAMNVRGRDLDQAAENLRMAISLGFRDLDMLRADLDAWLLLARPDIRPLLEDLQFPDQPIDSQPRK